MNDSQQVEIKAGIYKARAIKGQEQYGESKGGKPELLLLMNVPELGRQLTAALYFSLEAAAYSVERLRACGWKGQSMADLHDLSGIDDKDVDLEVKYEPYEGVPKMKVQILTGGGGRFNSAKPMEPKAFAAMVVAITGNSGAGGAGAGGAPPPPFVSNATCDGGREQWWKC